MVRFQSVVAVICSVLVGVPSVAAQTNLPPVSNRTQGEMPAYGRPEGRFTRLTGNYRPVSVAPVNLTNSYRLESLIRAGNLYLSLQDAIALVLENNLDVEIQR